MLACLSACGGGETTSDPKQLPTGEIASIEVSPKAVLLTDDIDSKLLRVRAFDADGQEVRADGLDIEWVNADPGDIALVPEGEDTASVTAVQDVGSGVIVARSKARTELLSNPVVVRAAVLHPEVVALADEDIVFPPPNTAPGGDMLELPGFGLNADGKISVGEFEVAELLLSLTTSSAEAPQFDENGAMLADPAARLRYPVVIARAAYVPGMTRIVGAESSPVAGTVLQAVERGDYVGLMVEAASATELYEELDLEFDGPALQEQGLLNLESLAPASPPPTVGFRSGTPEPLKPYNEGDCVVGDISGVTVKGLGITITPNILPPKGGIKIHGFGIEYFKIYSGVHIEAAVRPELNIQFAGSYTASCYFGDEFSGTLGLSALTGSILDARYKHKPRLDMKFEIGGGPRLNAYVLFLCKLRATFGMTFEGGEYSWSDPVAGDYNTVEASCNPPELDATFSGVDRDVFGGISRGDAGIDGFIDAEAGVVSENRLALLLGGAIIDTLIKTINQGEHTQKVIKEMADRFANTFPLPFNAPPLPQHWRDKLDKAVEDAKAVKLIDTAEKLLWGIMSLAEIDFLSFDWGPVVKMRVESTRKLLNEADGGTWYANQHQVLGVQINSQISVGLVDFGKMLKAIFPAATALHSLPLSLTIAPPPFDAIVWYKGIQGEGSISHSAKKGSGNKGADFEIGDRLLLRVPGDFGQQKGVHFDGDSSNPLGGAIFIRNSLVEGKLEPIRRVGDLEYAGPESGFMMFEGELSVTDAGIRDHLVARKELYFVAYNEMHHWLSVPGYLGSYTDYDLLKVDVGVSPESIVESVEVPGAAKPKITLTNKSVNGATPLAVQVEVGPVPGWITPSFQTSPIAADGSVELSLTASCAAAGQKDAVVALKIKALGEADAVLGEQDKQVSVKLTCTAPPKPPKDGALNPPPAFVGTACPAVGNEVDYTALDLELLTYFNPDELQFGFKLQPFANNQCEPSYSFELPVPCDSHVDYQLWKMGGSVSFNDLGFGTAYFVWNPHYLVDGMWAEYGLLDLEPVSLLSYAQESAPLTPCNDARMDLMSGPTGPIISMSEHPNMIRAFPHHTRNAPDLSWPENYQQCYDRLEIKAGNSLVPCGAGTTSGALYIVVQPKIVVGSD